ncbi:uncharacterized protein [Danio rerio]|uniref:Uncharacterized protein n=1 Tax=Danio rerio TaxID=7955 RepID=A0AC58JPW7_DANRE
MSAIKRAGSLARTLPAWLARASPSQKLIRTIRIGFVIQFAKRLSKFTGVYFHQAQSCVRPVLREEIAVLLAKDAIEQVSTVEMESGFYSPYFIMPKKSSGLWPILDLLVLNRCHHRLRFKMLTQKCINRNVRPLDWFAAKDLKDAYYMSPYFHANGSFCGLRSRIEHDSTRSSPSSSLSVSLKVLWHLHLLGFQVNREKSWLAPMQSSSFFGLDLDSITMKACLSRERAELELNCRREFDKKRWSPENFSEAHAAADLWKGTQLHWHINCLELLAVFLTLHRFLPVLRGQHVPHVFPSEPAHAVTVQT